MLSQFWGQVYINGLDFVDMVDVLFFSIFLMANEFIGIYAWVFSVKKFQKSKSSFLNRETYCMYIDPYDPFYQSQNKL